MIEINLVPDIKQEFLRSQRLRARVISISILISLAAGGVVVFLGMAMGAQALRELAADSSIKEEYRKLINDNENINEIVTIQQQLSNISTLNDNKSISSRAFDLLTLINPKEPNDVKMTEVTVDPNAGTINIQGTAASSFNAVDALKKTILNSQVTFTRNGANESLALSSEVTLGRTSLGETTGGQKVLRFEMSFTYPTELFSNSKDITNLRIVTPEQTIDVTDSKLRVPDSLFTQPAKDVGGSS